MRGHGLSRDLDPSPGSSRFARLRHPLPQGERESRVGALSLFPSLFPFLRRASSSLFFYGAGTPVFRRLISHRAPSVVRALCQNEGAERREALPKSRAFQRARPITQGARLSTLRLGDFAPRGRASGPGRAAAFAAVCPVRVQPLKAAPRSWSGRRPEASRTCACEARGAGAAPSPRQTAPCRTPLSGEGDRNIILTNNQCQEPMLQPTVAFAQIIKKRSIR